MRLGETLSVAAASAAAPKMQPVLTKLMQEVWAVKQPQTGADGTTVDKWVARHDLIEAYRFGVRGNPDFAHAGIFTAHENALLRVACDEVLEAGFGNDAADMRDIMQ
eukprot:3433265-Prymnesium_polylepis.1